MKLGKRNVSLCLVTVVSLGLCTVTLLHSKSQTVSLAEGEDGYSLSFGASSRFTDNGGEMTSIDSNPILFTYSGLSDPTSGWQDIAPGGSFYNVTPISGLASFVYNGETGLKLDYGFEADEYPISDEALSNGEPYDFNGLAPTYFRIRNDSGSTIRVQSMKLAYSCSRVEEDPFVSLDQLSFELDPWGIGFYVAKPKNRSTISGRVVVPSRYSDSVRGNRIVGAFEFVECPNLEEIVLPATVDRSLGLYPFYNCPKLRAIHVDPSNEHYHEEDGVLFNKERTNLIRYPGAKTGVHFTVPNGVQRILNGAFSQAANLQSVTLPNGLERISSSAFNSASSLVSIDIPSSVYAIEREAFKNCSSLSSIALTNDFMTMGDSAFEGCASLRNVILPEGPTEIPYNFFRGCTSLTSILLPSTITSIGNEAFGGCSNLEAITLHSGLEYIGEMAFYGCASISDLSIPLTVTFIGDSAFSNCDSLTGVIIPAGVQFLGSAFSYCAELRRVVFDNDYLTSIGNFSGCPKLEEIVFPRNMTSIGSYAFQNCVSLKSVTLPNALESIGQMSFASTAISSLVIPENVTSIGYAAFRDCALLEEARIEANISSLPDDMFYGCVSLRDVDLPNTLTEIGNDTFHYCSSLSSIDLPDGLESIGAYGFNECSSLSSISFPSSLRYIGEYAFSGCAISTFDLRGLEVELANYSCMDPGSADFYISDTATLGYSSVPWGRDLNFYIEVTSIEDFLAFEGKRYIDSLDIHLLDTNGDEITELVIPEGITSIGTQLSRCAYITSIALPSTLSSIENEAFDGCKSLRSIDIPGSVTSIGRDAFRNCDSLTEVTFHEGLQTIASAAFMATPIARAELPASMTMIGGSAFKQCSSLQSVDIPSGTIANEAFDGCVSLKDLKLGAGVTSIGSYAFSGCVALESLVIPNSVIALGKRAFENDTALQSVKIGNGLSRIQNSAFSSCESLRSLDLGESVETIEESAFSHCYSLLTVTLPSSLVEIGYYAFDSCTKIKEIVNLSALPLEVGSSSYGEVARYAWGIVADPGQSHLSTLSGGFVVYDGTKLVDYRGNDHFLTLPEGITSIEDGAFRKCDFIISFTTNTSLETIGNAAFPGCVRLAEIINRSSLTISPKNPFEYNYSRLGAYALQVIEDSAFSKTSIDGDGLALYDQTTLIGYFGEETELVLPSGIVRINEYALRGESMLTAVTLPSGLTYIGGYAFYGCSSLESIVIPEGVSSIQSYTFYLCGALRSITLPEGLIEIGASAFDQCTSLSSIVIPAGVTSIETNTFYNCASLSSVTFLGQVESIGMYAFRDCGFASIALPSSVTSIGYYAFTNDRNYLSQILYAGTIAEWNAIEKGEIAYSYANITIVCSDGEIPLNS